MDNPFVYSSTVEGESFCNRKQELSELTEFCLSGQNVLVYAHRRYGKTSLITVLSNKLKKNKPIIKTFYIDLYGTLDEKDFIEAIFGRFFYKIQKHCLARQEMPTRNKKYKATRQ